MLSAEFACLKLYFPAPTVFNTVSPVIVNLISDEGHEKVFPNSFVKDLQAAGPLEGLLQFQCVYHLTFCPHEYSSSSR